jgi:serine/threonine protein kinase
MPDDISAIGNMVTIIIDLRVTCQMQDFLGPSLRWSSELTDFLDKCLVLDPYERPTSKQLLEVNKVSLKGLHI